MIGQFSDELRTNLPNFVGKEYEMGFLPQATTL
jgi:hypothetical protein